MGHHVSSLNDKTGNLTAADVFESVPSTRMGTATLVAGEATVSTTLVTADSIILLTHQNEVGTVGFLTVSDRTASTSFAISSSSSTDTSKVGWLLLEPAS